MEEKSCALGWSRRNQHGLPNGSMGKSCQWPDLWMSVVAWVWNATHRFTCFNTWLCVRRLCNILEVGSNWKTYSCRGCSQPLFWAEISAFWSHGGCWSSCRSGHSPTHQILFPIELWDQTGTSSLQLFLIRYLFTEMRKLIQQGIWPFSLYGGGRGMT